MQRPMFTFDLGDGYALALRDMSTARAFHELTIKNIDRLRRWEQWAHEEPTEAGMLAFTRSQLDEWLDGRALPWALLADGLVVGAVSARINRYAATAELGYWIDADHEGRGAMTRAVAALIDALFQDGGIARIEIRTSAANARSRALAERLGFAHEGTLRSAGVVGAERHDVAVYGLLADR